MVGRGGRPSLILDVWVPSGDTIKVYRSPLVIPDFPQKHGYRCAADNKQNFLHRAPLLTDRIFESMIYLVAAVINSR